MNRLRIIAAVFFFSCCNLTAVAQRGTFIEFGWDYPDVSQLNTDLPSMQNTPFDGICFSLQRQILEAFDTTLQLPAYFEQDKLKQLKWGKYNNNFIILRGYGKMGGSWFDDTRWKTISSNMRNLSKALASPEISGVLFDPEYYYEDPLYNPWTYSKKQYPHHSFAEMQLQVKKRGIQFIKVLQKYKPDLAFLSIWITSLVVEDIKLTPLEGTRHALLLSFIEGILTGKKNTVKVIDGNEYGYGYMKPSQFLDAANYLRKNLAELMQSGKGREEALKIEIAQPLFYDGLLATNPSFERGISTKAKWKWLEENTKFAMAASDDITWFYSERLNWWKGPVNDTLYQLLTSNKNAQNTNVAIKSKATMADRLAIRTKNINTGTGYYYIVQAKKPMNNGGPAFNYQLNRSSKKLTLQFPDKIPDSIFIFINNGLHKSLSPISTKQVVALSNFKKGKVVILARYPDNTEASAIEIYR